MSDSGNKKDDKFVSDFLEQNQGLITDLQQAEDQENEDQILAWLGEANRAIIRSLVGQHLFSTPHETVTRALEALQKEQEFFDQIMRGVLKAEFADSEEE
jgi:hypothetical protein